MPAPNNSPVNPDDIHINIIESQACISDRYKEISYIGQGAFSLVFKAKDSGVKDNTSAALKFFKPSCYTNEYRLKSFNRESKILNDLRNQENILPLRQEKTEFTVNLPYNGQTLPVNFVFYAADLATSSVQNYIYDSTEASYLTNIRIFREMCKATQRIHGKEICHRDLKPDNFLIHQNGQAKDIWLADFGTAKCLKTDEAPLSSNYFAAVGDMRYVAPELICGLNFQEECNYSADIYSLGVILFEFFTRTVLGPILFPGPTLSHITRHSHSLPPDKRMEFLSEILAGLAKDTPLPGIREYNVDVPPVIAVEIDNLYRLMASFNYKQRLKDFNAIFALINRCEQSIIHTKKHEEWRKIKKMRMK